VPGEALANVFGKSNVVAVGVKDRDDDVGGLHQSARVHVNSEYDTEIDTQELAPN
jgi:chloramphenicol 3-O-phosphotransferase